MAEAPGHRLGQIIGDALELALEPVLKQFAIEHDLYLDCQGSRPARPGKKVTWTDSNGNSHDLDFVLERGGTPNKIGVPVAFIESAWRRYTKHSRNKAQEIQGAIEPLIRKYASVKPLGGAIVGGNWTTGALDQLTSLGFAVAHIDYDEVVAAFEVVGISVATEESTTDAELLWEVNKFQQLTDSDRARLGQALRACAPEEFARFRSDLERAVVRKLERLLLLPVHGNALECTSIEEAVKVVNGYDPRGGLPEFVRWEISMRFTNGDRIDASFQDNQLAIDFMRSFGAS